MATYHWYSRRFADYSDGSILVEASSVEEARGKAIVYYNSNFGDGVEERYAARLDRSRFMADITHDPEVVDVTVIYGGG